MFMQQLLPHGTLEGSEMELFFFIVPDYKLDTAVAEIANPIKKYQRMIHVLKDTLLLPHTASAMCIYMNYVSYPDATVWTSVVKRKSRLSSEKEIKFIHHYRFI